MDAKGTHKEVTIQTKHEASQELEKGWSNKNVANQFETPGSILSISNKHNILDVSPIIKPYCPISRHGIALKEVLASERKVTKEMIVSCEENILPTTLSRYQLNEIYNVYEFSLFYKALPSKSLYFQA